MENIKQSQPEKGKLPSKKITDYAGEKMKEAAEYAKKEAEKEAKQPKTKPEKETKKEIRIDDLVTVEGIDEVLKVVALGETPGTFDLMGESGKNHYQGCRAEIIKLKK